MANTLLTIDMITRESLRILHGTSAFIKNVNRDYDPSFAKQGAKIGSTLRIRKPNKYTVTDGRVMTAQDTVEQKVDLAVATQKHVAMNFTSEELTLSMDDFSKRIIKPAISVLAASIDYDALSMSLDVYNSVGTPGTTPASAQVWLDAGAKLDENLAPADDRCIILSPAAQARTVSGLSALFHDGDLIADQYRNGVMKRGLGFKWAMDQNVRNLTTGTNANRATTIDLAANVTTGDSTLSVDGLSGTTVTITAGEVFTIAGCYQVNSETKASTGVLQQFVVTATGTGSGSAITNLAISPTIYGPTSGALQNVSVLPSSGDDLVFYGTTASTVYPQNLAFHRDAFTIATADLPMPKAAQMASRQVLDGISMRVWQGDDIINDTFPCRVDVLYGFVATYPELATRVWG